MKRLLSFILSAVVVTITILSCSDDFNEQDFLRLQSDLKIKQDSIRRARNKAVSDSSTKEVVQSYIDARNASGDLMAVTVIVREDNTPISGVAVSISSGAEQTGAGRTMAIVTDDTDANGVAIFDAVVISNSTITISRTGYVTASALVDFGSPEPPIEVTVPDLATGGTKTIYIAPPKQFHNISLPLFSESATSGNTAVFNGNFVWQQDLTNDPNVRDPLPAGLQIAADIGSAMIASGAISGSVPVGDYRFSGAAGSLGVAAIDPATGDFSMRVPATAAGMDIDLIYPTVSANQRVAVRRLNGLDITPEFRQVPTLWAPGNSASSSPIPQIPGAMAVFNGGTPPPAPGRGWGATFAVIARGLGTGTISNTSPGVNNINNNTYQIVLRGRGFSSSPAVTITGGGGTGATATSALQGFITAATVTATGSGYTASTPYDIQFTYTDASASIVAIGKIDVTSNPAGEIPLANLTLPNAVGFPPSGTMFVTSQGMQGFGVRVVNDGTSTPATATVQATITFTTDTEVSSVVITNGGSGFNSAPTLTFSGGGSPSTQASIAVLAYRSQHTITLSTTPATTPYKLVPAGLVFTYATAGIDAQVVESPALVDRLSTDLTAVVAGTSFVGQVVTDGTNLSALNPQYTFRTNRFWTSAPTLSIVDQLVAKAAANLQIAATGEITAIVNPNGDAPTANDLFPTAGSTIPGDGYDGITVAILPTITGAPGTGAVFLLTTTTDVASEEVTWSGPSTRVSGGTGYMPNLNRHTSATNYPAATPLTVQTGQTYFRSINMGEGVRLENVGN